METTLGEEGDRVPSDEDVSVVVVEPGSDLASSVAALQRRPGQRVFVVATTSSVDSAKFALGAKKLASMSKAADLEHVVAALAPEIAIPSAAVTEQARRNTILRERLLAEFGALSARDVADLAGSTALNRAQYAHALVRAGRAFSVVHRRQTVFPGFQFDTDAGSPLPVIADVLALLRARFDSDWEVAHWFVAPNTWIQGRRPVDLLTTHPEDVIDAAQAGLDRGGF